MFEGDILTPAGAPPGVPGTPALAAPAPQILVPAAPVVPGPPDLGLLPIAPQEVDALSYGTDDQVPPLPWLVDSFYFSVDEFAMSVARIAGGPPSVFSEGAFGIDLEASADSFVNAFTIPAPPPLGPPPALPPPSPFAGNVARIDGNGLINASGLDYPGVGLVEPNSPFVPGAASLDPGDNVDALDVDTTEVDVDGLIYFSLDSAFADPLEPPPAAFPLPNFGSAVANGFVGGDVLVSAAGGIPAVFAPAAALGLDLIDVDGDGMPDMDSDDLDALILWENGTLAFEPSAVPYDWMGGATDMLLFSVRRGSAVVGAPDSRYGLPISPGDLLTTPVPAAAGGLSPFPAIFLPAEYFGLATIRSGTAVDLFGIDADGDGMPDPFDDDLDALDYVYRADCNTNNIWDESDIDAGTSLDCNSNRVPDECDLIGNDCNTNAVPDDCDISGGTSVDCNTNVIPDECEITGADCNTNGTLDACDIAGPTSDDCNTNAIPDECDLASGTAPDCNSNGRPDVCDVSAGPVSFLLGAAQTYADDPMNVAVADVDGDGDPDLLVPIYSQNAVYLQRNNGDGTFAAPVSFAVGAFPRFVTTADLNGDSDADFITANVSAGGVTLRQNMDGLGSFTVRNDFSTGTGPASLAPADYDADGDIDLAVVNPLADNIVLLRLSGFGTTVQGTSTLTVGDYPYSVVSGDLDGDLDPDLVVSNYLGNSISVLLNNGNGTFAPRTDYALPFAPEWLALADLDRDGDPEVLVAQRADDSIRVFNNNGSGALMLTYMLPVGETPIGVTAADINGDGWPDVVSANGGIVDGFLTGVSVVLNNGAGGFNQAAVNFPVPVSAIYVVPADFDRDGRVDLAVAGNNRVFVLFNRTAPVSADCNSNGTPDSCDIASGAETDCNASGTPDSCELNSPIRFVEPAATATTTSFVWDFITGDFDLDGDIDVLRIGSLARIYLFRNDGNASFMEASPLTVPGDPRWLLSADLDADGDPDVAVGDSNARVHILRNDGTGALTLATSINLGGWPYPAVAADLDGDGDLDLAMSHASGPGGRDDPPQQRRADLRRPDHRYRTRAGRRPHCRRPVRRRCRHRPRRRALFRHECNSPS